MPTMTKKSTPTPSALSPWMVLERLVRELQQNVPIPQQLHCALEAIRDSTRADAVFWYPPTKQGQVVRVGDSRVTLEWCRSFAAPLVESMESDQKQHLWHNHDEDHDADPAPFSAALHRVGSSLSGWLVAVSLDSARPFRETDLELLSLAHRLVLSQNQQTKLHAKLKDSLFGLIRCLSTTIDAKDPCTAGHSERVARIAVLIAKQMGLPTKTVNSIFLAGLLHDIGKIGVPDAILQKPSRLTRKEFAAIQEHVVIGDRILSGVKQLEPLRPAVRSHHERYDGKGYPDGLAGDAIPLMARIMAVADSCDAMMSSRRYRQALVPPQIDAIFHDGAGQQWDPEIIRHFMACRADIYPPIYQKGIGESAFHAVADLAEGSRDGSSMFFNIFAPDANETMRPE